MEHFHWWYLLILGFIFLIISLRKKIWAFIGAENNRLTFILAFLALVFSIGIPFVQSQWEDSKIFSFENRPYLSIVGTPKIQSAGYFVEKYDSINNAFLTSLSIKISITLKNTGSSDASILMFTCLENPSGLDTLRKLINDEKYTRWKCGLYDSFFVFRQLRPLDTITYLFERRIHDVKNDTTALHFLFYYSNDEGVIFDTYFWLRIFIKNKMLNYKYIQKPDCYFLEINNDSTKKEINFVDYNQQNKTYSKNESKKLMKRFDLMLEKKK